MSWAEVKKINSNLSKPLDEILNDSTSGLSAIKNLAVDIKDNTDSLLAVPKAFQFVKTSGTPTTSTPLTLSISGAGKLYGITFSSPVIASTSSNVKTQWLIYIDGEYVLNHSFHNESSSDFTIEGIITSPDTLVLTRYEATLYYGVFGIYPSFISSDSRYGLSFDLPLFQSEATAETLSSRRDKIAYLNNPIPFNTICDIQVRAVSTSLSSSASVRAVYTLD